MRYFLVCGRIFLQRYQKSINYSWLSPLHICDDGIKIAIYKQMVLSSFLDKELLVYLQNKLIMLQRIKRRLYTGVL